MDKKSFKDAGIAGILIKVINSVQTTIVIYKNGSRKEYRSLR